MSGKWINLIKTCWARLTFRGEPSPECWVFSSVHNRTFNYNSRYLFLYVKEHFPGIRPYYVVEDRKLREELSNQYGAEYFIDTGTLEGIRKILSCKVWFTSTAPPLYGIGFKRKYKIYNLWHGVPLKKVGMEQGNLSFLTKLYYRYFFADNYEGVLTTSHHLIPVMSKSFLVKQDRIRVWGQPRNDCLFTVQDAKEILGGIYGENLIFHKAVLYAPTFRDHGETCLFPFPQFRENPVRSRRILEDFLEAHNILLCIRIHLYDHTDYQWLKNADCPGSRIRFLNEDRVEDVMTVLNCFDLLITDYSSIYIDYLLTGRPVLFLPYDKEYYLADRGLNFPYEQVTPGPKPENLQDFLLWMERLLDSEQDPYGPDRIQVNEFFNSVREPCSETICRNVVKELDLNFL